MPDDPVATRKPNTLIIGAMKASTTLLYTLLSQHPAVFFPADKEPTYFTRPDWQDPAVRRRYLSLFAACPADAAIVAEASTNYSKLPHFGDTPGRIREFLGEPKLIYILRDPVGRVVSNYRHSYVIGGYRAGTTLREALDEDPILIDASCYARQIRAYEAEFGPGSVHVVIAEELHDHQGEVMRGVANHLGIDPLPVWDEPAPAVNAIGQLALGHRFERWLGKGLKRKLSDALPASFKTRLKVAAARRVPDVPEPTEGARQVALERVADDLRELHHMLGDRIDRWPSVRALDALAPHAVGAQGMK